MAGVIDSKGQQWEHCNVCGDFVKIQNLGFLRPSKPGLLDSLDVCMKCANEMLLKDQKLFRRIDPGQGWLVKRLPEKDILHNLKADIDAI